MGSFAGFQLEKKKNAKLVVMIKFGFGIGNFEKHRKDTGYVDSGRVLEMRRINFAWQEFHGKFEIDFELEKYHTTSLFMGTLF